MTSLLSRVLGKDSTNNNNGASSDPNMLSLSEEACQDLVLNLMQLGFLPKLMTSLDGKEFITPEQLDKEILDKLGQQQGRVDLVTLGRMLNVTPQDLQTRVTELIRMQAGKLFQIQESLFESSFIDNMIMEMSKELEDGTGYFQVASQCRKYDLGLDFMNKVLADRLGTTLRGTVEAGSVYSPEYLSRQQSVLVSELEKATEPLTATTLFGRHVVNDALFYGLLERILKAKVLPGTFKGIRENIVYTPLSYQSQQQKQSSFIDTFLDQNGFIEYQVMAKNGEYDPKNRLQKQFPQPGSIMLLDTCALLEKSWAMADAAVEDAITSLSWVDIKPLLPSPLTKTDLGSVLQQLPALKYETAVATSAENTSQFSDTASTTSVATVTATAGGGYNGGPAQEVFIIQDRIVITSGQIQKCFLGLQSLVDQRAKAMAIWKLTGKGGKGPAHQQPTHQHKVYSQKGRKDRVVQDDLLTTVGGKRKQLREKKQAVTTTAVAATSQDSSEFLSIQDVEQELEQIEPDFEPILVTAVAGSLFKALVMQLQERNRTFVLTMEQEEEQATRDTAPQVDSSIGANKKSPRELATELLMERLDQVWIRLVTAARGINTIEDATVQNSLCKYLIQSVGSECIDLFVLVASARSVSTVKEDGKTSSLCLQILDQFWKTHQEQPDHEVDSLQSILSKDQVQQLYQELLDRSADPYKTDLARLWKLSTTTKFKSLKEFLLQSNKVSPEMDADCPPNLDALPTTTISRYLETHTQELVTQLAKISPGTEHALLLHLVALVTLYRWTGETLQASGKFVPKILKQLSVVVSRTDPESDNFKDRQQDLVVLNTYLDLIMQDVKSGGQDQAVISQLADQWANVQRIGLTSRQE